MLSLEIPWGREGYHKKMQIRQKLSTLKDYNQRICHPNTTPFMG